jgi:hypothetical protein
MNANLQDMLLIVASFLLVLGGVTYWLYTAIEQNQRKIGVLENVLYELRFTIQEKMNQPPSYEHTPHSSTEEEVEEREQGEQVSEDEKVVALNREYSEPPESVAGEVINTMKEFEDDLPVERDLDDLRPGGVLDLNEDEILNDWNKKPNKEEKNFKNLFVGSNAPTESTPLDAMSLKDLRSMASQRKITGAKNMKRNELVEALRVQLPSVSAVESPQNVIRSLE